MESRTSRSRRGKGEALAWRVFYFYGYESSNVRFRSGYCSAAMAVQAGDWMMGRIVRGQAPKVRRVAPPEGGIGDDDVCSCRKAEQRALPAVPASTGTSSHSSTTRNALAFFELVNR